MGLRTLRDVWLAVTKGWASQNQVAKPGHGAPKEVDATRDRTLDKHLGPAVGDLRWVPRSSPAAARGDSVWAADPVGLLGLATLMLTAVKPRLPEGGGPLQQQSQQCDTLQPCAAIIKRPRIPTQTVKGVNPD